MYWTNDWNDHGTALREDCALFAAASENEARYAAYRDMEKSVELEPGERIVSDEIGESDCWAKVPREWSISDIHDYARGKGVEPGHLYIRRPHEHPGNSGYAWVSITAPVFAARVEPAPD